MPRQGPTKPELPRSEPEIIPPERGRTRAYSSAPDWFPADQRSRSGIYVGRIGTWRVLGIVLLIGLVAGATLGILLGTLLIAVPIVAVLIAPFMISSALRSHLRRPR